MPEPIPPTRETKNADLLFRSGVGLSVVYLLGLGGYVLVCWDGMMRLSPDEFASFLSGVFAPLAFLWLVLGFRQQGDELQNSARALWLQGEELRNSVEQQRQLVEVSREQLTAEYAARVREEEDADRAAQPQLLITLGGMVSSGKARSLYLNLGNAGPSCSDLTFTSCDEEKFSAGIFSEGTSREVRFSYDSPIEIEPLSISVTYTDRRGNRRSQYFRVPVEEAGGASENRTFGVPVKTVEP
jgi:hypothetical protein